MSRNLEQNCGGNQPNGLRWPHATLLVAENHRLLFCPIGKNACTTLKRLMVSLSDIEHKGLMLAKDIHRSVDRHRTGAKLLDHSLADARRIMRSDEYFKFAVLRDPFSRLASAFVEKFVINRRNPANQYHTGPVIDAVQHADSPDFRRGITFADFIRQITAQAPESLDPHWRPQTLYLQGVRYDRIYRVDQLDDLKRDLEQRVGHPIDLESMNRSSDGRSRYVAGAAHMLPGQLKAPRGIDKHSFMESELMFRVVDYFADDYRFYLNGRQGDEPAAASPRTSASGVDSADPPPRRNAALQAGRSRKTSARPAAKNTLRRPLVPNDILFFLHMPKCGGTTFNSLLHQMFRRDSELYENPYRRRDLLATSRDDLRSYRLIRGHFQYPDVVRKLGFQPRTVTFLRDPVARFISHFHMRKRQGWEPRSAAQKAYREELNNMPIEQFLERPDLTRDLANLQYRFLAGYRVDRKSGLTECGFDQPYESLLDNFEVVGILERFDESLETFCFVFDLPPISTYSNQNVSPNRDRESQFSQDVLERVAELNQHDLQLYALAQQRFQRQRQQMQAEIERHGGDLPMLEQPQDMLRLDMSRVPPGNNWWDSTEHRRFGCVRWTGPGNSASLFLPLTPGSKNIQLTVVDAKGEDVLRSLKLVVEGTVVPLTCESKRKRFPRVYTGTIPGEVVQARRRTKLSLETSATLPARGAWKKRCGICVSSLEICPTEAAADNTRSAQPRPDAA